MDPVTEFLEYKEKVAAINPRQAAQAAAGAAGQAAAGSKPMGFMRRMMDHPLGAAALFGGAATIGGAIEAVGEDVYDKAKQMITRATGFKRMMKANPQLGQMDRGKVQTAYRTLHNFNPDFAADPFVAASWVRKMNEYDYVDPETVGRLVGARKKVQRRGLQERGTQMAKMLTDTAGAESRAYQQQVGKSRAMQQYPKPQDLKPQMDPMDQAYRAQWGRMQAEEEHARAMPGPTYGEPAVDVGWTKP